MKLLYLLLLFLNTIAHSKVATFGIIGDAGYWTNATRQVRDSMLASGVQELILPGDNLYEESAGYHEAWKNWFSAGFKFPLVAIGNHTAGYSQEMSYFGMESEFYTKVINSARFIVLNSDNVHTVREQGLFLENSIANAKEQFIFIVYHHPPFSLRHSWREKEAFQLATRPILLKYRSRITSIIVGHDHIASLVNMQSIPVIVSGAVFESFNIPRVDYVENHIAVKTMWSSHQGHYWTRLDINDESGEVWVNFVRADKHGVDCSARIAPRPVLMRPNCL